MPYLVMKLLAYWRVSSDTWKGGDLGCCTLGNHVVYFGENEILGTFEGLEISVLDLKFLFFRTLYIWIAAIGCFYF
jgi:hypothetical protein